MKDYRRPDAPVPVRRGYIGRLKELKGTLDRANKLLIEIVGHPLDGQDSVCKEPNSLTEQLALDIEDAQAAAVTVVQQLERLHGDLA